MSVIICTEVKSEGKLFVWGYDAIASKQVSAIHAEIGV